MESAKDLSAAVETVPSSLERPDFFSHCFLAEENFQIPEISTDMQRNRAIERDIFNYLNDPLSGNLSILDNYEYIKKAYIYLNTTLPASAAVERLFSVGGQIFTSLRNRMTDNTFEARLFLQANAREFELMKM
jgi:hypothetical protein